MREWAWALAAAVGTAGVSAFGLATLATSARYADLLASLAFWILAGALGGGSVRAALHLARVPAGPVGPAAAWTVGALVGLQWTPLELVPTGPTFVEDGPALAEWMGAGTLALALLPSERGGRAARGAASVAPRTAIVFGLGYGALWSLFASIQATRGLPELAMVGAFFAGTVLVAFATGVAAAFPGPPDLKAQLPALAIGCPAVLATVPKLADAWAELARHALAGEPLRRDHVAATLAAGVVGGLAVAIGAVAIWVRHRHHQRIALAEAA